MNINTKARMVEKLKGTFAYSIPTTMETYLLIGLGFSTVASVAAIVLALYSATSTFKKRKDGRKQ